MEKLRYDYYVNTTIYDKDDKLDKEKSNKRYISHEITERLQQNPNVYFLTPLSKQRYIYADILPYTNQTSTYRYISFKVILMV